MSNRLAIGLLLLCVVLTAICVYQFNQIQALNTQLLNSEALQEDEPSLNKTLSEKPPINNESEYQQKVEQLKLEINSLKQKLEKTQLANIKQVPLQEDPETDEQRREEHKNTIRNDLAILLAELNLPFDKEEELINLIAQNHESYEPEIEKKIADLFNNPDSLKLYQNFKKYEYRASRVISELSETLKYNNLAQLTKQQEHQLTLLEVNNQAENFEPSFDQVASNFPEIENMSIDEAVDVTTEFTIKQMAAHAEKTQQMTDKILNEAKMFLSPEQYADFKTTKENTITGFPSDLAKTPAFQELMKKEVRRNILRDRQQNN